MRHTQKVIKKEKPLSRNTQFFILSLFPMYFLIIGLVLEPLPVIMEGLKTIIREPDFLITDYVYIGGPGAAFVNASLLTLISIGIIYFLKMEITGATFTSLYLMMGFSLFGKNIVNIWAILLGVWVYSIYHRQHLSKYIYVGFYGTSLSPIITQVIVSSHLNFFFSILASMAVGIIIGFVLPPLSTHLSYAHKGYSLYNVGFAAGLIATIIISIFKSYGLELESRSLWASGYNMLFLEVLVSFFIILIVIGFILEHQLFYKYKQIIKEPGIAGTDFMLSQGLGATMFNMGVNGIAATLFVVMVNGDLNGPSMGGIFTIVGFSATGKHLRNILPIMFGVWLASLTTVWNINDPSVILALLFSTTLAPIAGKFGVICGLIAGFIHSCVVLNVGVIYGGMNLYNNGFAGALVAAFIVPVINSIEDRRARARGVI